MGGHVRQQPGLGDTVEHVAAADHAHDLLTSHYRQLLDAQRVEMLGHLAEFRVFLDRFRLASHVEVDRLVGRVRVVDQVE